MRISKFIFFVLLLIGFTSCGAKAIDNSEQVTAADDMDTNDGTCIELLNTVYNNFVFRVGSDGINPEEYFTPKAMKKLRDAYGFDRENGSHYAYYELRTGAQDSRPGADGMSVIYSINPDGNGWYVVSYSDMGWPGKTRVRIVDGKIDEFERLVE